MTRGQHHDGADRQVDAGGQDHQRLGDAEHGDDGDLLQHQRQVEQGEEAPADHHGEDGDAHDQHDEGNCRRVFMQEMLQLPQPRTAILLEAGDGPVVAGQPALGRRLAAPVVAHRPALPPAS